MILFLERSGNNKKHWTTDPNDDCFRKHRILHFVVNLIKPHFILEIFAYLVCPAKIFRKIKTRIL